MARTLGTDFSAQLDSSSFTPFYAVSIGFSPNKLNLWTGYSDLFFDSETYVGSGNLLGLSNIEETSDIKATGMTLTLSGIDSNILSEVLTEDVQGITVEIYFGVLATIDNETKMVDTPYKVFDGFIDTMAIQEGAVESIVRVSVENKLITLEKAKAKRYTDQDQKQLFSGDKGLEFVDDLQDKSLVWGGGTRN
tara:strand:+ start:786 stop:1364 length:579 start_codon:yes stop_codon:yes gene_type:complete